MSPRAINKENTPAAPKPAAAPKLKPVAAPQPVAAAAPEAAAAGKSDVPTAPLSKTRQLAEQGVEKLVAVVSALEGSGNTSHQRIKDEILAPIAPILKEMAEKAWGDSLP